MSRRMRVLLLAVVTVSMLWLLHSDPRETEDASFSPATHDQEVGGQHARLVGQPSAPPPQSTGTDVEPNPPTSLPSDKGWILHGVLVVSPGTDAIPIRKAFRVGADLSGGLQMETVTVMTPGTDVPFSIGGSGKGRCWLDILGKAAASPQGVNVYPGLTLDLGRVDCTLLPVIGLVLDESDVPQPAVVVHVADPTKPDTLRFVTSEDGTFTFESGCATRFLVSTEEQEVLLPLEPTRVELTANRRLIIRVRRKVRVRVACLTEDGVALVFPFTVGVMRLGQAESAFRHPYLTLDGELHVAPGRYEFTARVDSLLGAYRSEAVVVEIAPDRDEDITLVCRPTSSSCGLLRLRFLVNCRECSAALSGRLLLSSVDTDGEILVCPIPEGREFRGPEVVCPLDDATYRVQVCTLCDGQMFGCRPFDVAVNAGKLTTKRLRLVKFGAVDIARDVLGKEGPVTKLEVLDDRDGTQKVAPAVWAGNSWRFWGGSRTGWPNRNVLRVWLPEGWFSVQVSSAHGSALRRVGINAGAVQVLTMDGRR